MIAAALAILSGGYLWRTLHQGVFETMEKVLGVGVIAALLALLIQLFVAGPALRKLHQASDGDTQRSRIAVAQRIAAALLVVTALSMAAARYA
jgi:hypothetical protein